MEGVVYNCVYDVVVVMKFVFVVVEKGVEILFLLIEKVRLLLFN